MVHDCFYQTAAAFTNDATCCISSPVSPFFRVLRTVKGTTIEQINRENIHVVHLNYNSTHVLLLMKNVTKIGVMKALFTFS